MDDYVKIGKVVNTFGLKGELKITSESDFIVERFDVNKKIYFKNHNEYKEYVISSFRYLKGNVIITINNLYDINEVTKFVGYDVYASADDEIVLDDGEFYIDDLVGLKVYDENNNYLGIVNDVIILPNASDVLEIINDDKQLLIPFVDEYIIEISDKIIIKNLEVEK